MRIVGGALGGRRFAGPAGEGARPTSERVREAVASALVARGAIEGSVVLDLFAGTGALAFEALSRGAERAVLVERDRQRIREIEQSVGELELQDRVRLAAIDLLREPKSVAKHLSSLNETYTLVFVDPPYADTERVPALLIELLSAGVIAEQALMLLEHAARQVPEIGAGLSVAQSYRYGDTGVLLIEPV
jgi:16S rRNA (guanine966-N2)-methyltransferase